MDASRDSIDLSQYNLLRQIKAYLRDERYGERDKEFIEQFERGYCAGISALWLCAKWIQTQDNKEKKVRDDYDWFESVVRLIASWDKKGSCCRKR